MTIKFLNTYETADAAAIWKSLEAEVDHVTITSSWDWVETWLTHYSGLVEYWFAVGLQKNKPCAIALITKETNRPLPFPVKAFHIGTGGEPFQDRVRMSQSTILAGKKTKAAFVSNLMETLMKTFSPEEVVFDDYSKDDAALIQKILKKEGYKSTVESEPTLFLDLETIRNAKGDVISSFGSNMRRSVRRSLKVFGEVNTEWAESKEQALVILDELIGFYQTNQRKLGRAGMFTSPYFTAFQKDIVAKLVEQKKVILFRVVSKTYGTIGCLYMFVDNGIAYSYQIGLNDFNDKTFEGISSNRLKTSYIVHALCMQECLNRGIKTYNFLMGVYRYKTEMTNGSVDIASISVKNSIKPHLRDSIMSLYARFDEKRNSPQFLRYFRRLVLRQG